MRGWGVMGAGGFLLVISLACGGGGAGLGGPGAGSAGIGSSAAAPSDGGTIATEPGTVATKAASPGGTASTTTTAPPAAASPDATARAVGGTPAAGTAGSGDYPATVAGVCQRLNDCGCNPMASVSACTRTMEAEHAAAREMLGTFEALGGLVGMADALDAELGLGDDPGAQAVASMEAAGVAVARQILDDPTEYYFRLANLDCALLCEEMRADATATTSGRREPRPRRAPRPREAPEPAEVVSAPPAPAAPVETTLVVRGTDGNWYDVRVNGREIGDGIKNSGEVSHRLAEGIYTVEVYEFMGDAPFTVIRAQAGQSPRIEVGVARGKSATCYDPTWCSVTR